MKVRQVLLVYEDPGTHGFLLQKRRPAVLSGMYLHVEAIGRLMAKVDHGKARSRGALIEVVFVLEKQSGEIVTWRLDPAPVSRIHLENEHVEVLWEAMEGGEGSGRSLEVPVILEMKDPALGYRTLADWTAAA